MDFIINPYKVQDIQYKSEKIINNNNVNKNIKKENIQLENKKENNLKKDNLTPELFMLLLSS